MKKWINIGILAVLVIGMVLVSGCTRDNSKYCPDNYPGTLYNPSTNTCDKIVTQTPYSTPTPTPQIVYVTVLVTQTTKPTPTPIPTINKNSVAYLNYKDDLQDITDIQTDLTILQSNYLTEMQNAGSDVSWMRSLTIEYNKLKAAYEIRLKAAQTKAAADLAEAKGE